MAGKAFPGRTIELLHDGAGPPEMLSSVKLIRALELAFII